MSGRRRACLRGLIAVAVAGGFLFGSLGSAQAATAAAADDPAAEPTAAAASVAPAASATSGTKTVTLTPNPAACGTAPCSAPLPTITCRISVEYPFLVEKSVWTWGTVSCNHPVAHIYMDAALSKNGSIVDLREGHVVGTNFHSVNSTKRCSTGFWRGHSEAWIVPPPGYYPPSGYIWTTSYELAITNVDCPPTQPPPPPPPGPPPGPPPCPRDLPNCQEP